MSSWIVPLTPAGTSGASKTARHELNWTVALLCLYFIYDPRGIILIDSGFVLRAERARKTASERSLSVGCHRRATRHSSRRSSANTAKYVDIADDMAHVHKRTSQNLGSAWWILKSYKSYDRYKRRAVTTMLLQSMCCFYFNTCHLCFFRCRLRRRQSCTTRRGTDHVVRLLASCVSFGVLTTCVLSSSKHCCPIHNVKQIRPWNN